MAPVKGQYTTILVDGYDLSGYSNNLTIQAQNGSIDVTPFESASKVYLNELTEGSIQHSGYFTSPNAGEMEKTLYDRIASQSAYITALLGTDTSACVAYVCPASGASSFQIQSPANGVIAVSAQWMAGTGLKRGKRIFNGTISATGGQSGVDNTSAGASGGGGYAYLHVTGISGTATNATITVQSSAASNFTSPTTHGTFTFSAIGGSAMSFSSTVLRYLRINLTSLGGATSVTCQAVMVVNGITMS